MSEVKIDERKIPKILAIYLPQFYENEDNNRWWGKGFTDWESVKTAEAYFPGHEEPRVPLGGDYYDLSRKETMMAQAQMAETYGIDGFCFYHYYFKDGKKELELPAENLLRWKDIPMPFCFNWASEPWIRSWSRISGNVWAERYETDDAEVKAGILAEQDYGTYEDWVRHFQYLLPFFKDERYIRVDRKPVFLFYSPEDIHPLQEMTRCWRELAVKAGLPGLYLIGARLNAPNDCLDAAVVYEPRKSINDLNALGKAVIKNGVRCFGYEDIWKNILDTSPVFGVKTYFCGVSGYDDTPRRGKSGESLIHRSSSVFQEYLTKLIQKSKQYENELLFINAWNEWGEGMYLEPDKADGYGYLEAIKNAREKAMEEPQIQVNMENNEAIKKELSRLNDNGKKFKYLFELLDKWLFLEQEGKVDFADFFQKEHISHVAIYGMASLGKHLLIQLRKENVDVDFGIDRYVGQFGSDFQVYRPEEQFPETDAIIITAYDVASIMENLKNKYHGRIIGLGEIIDDIYRMHSNDL